MILAFDTYYSDSKAKTVCICFDNWEDDTINDIYIESLECIEDYIPGEFYKRELPGILSILNNTTLNDVKAIIVDGYVILDDSGKLGLGGHLYKKVGQKIPIIGVAKSNYRSLKIRKKEVYRGMSKKPLYITTLGMEINIAYEKIKKMKGDYRIPSLLMKLDRLTKEK